MNYYDIISDKKELIVSFGGDYKVKVVYDSTKLNRDVLENKEKSDFDYIDKALNTLIVEWDLADREGNVFKTDLETLRPLHSGLKNDILYAIIQDGSKLKKK